MGQMVFAILMKYVEAHPDQIVELLGEATKAGVAALKKHNADQAAK